MSRTTRAAFTLVELLVVITIIGMLMAIVLPAINSAREAARRATCTNNQSEVAMALLANESKKTYFTGYKNSGDVSWVVTILPEIGRNDIYDSWPPATIPQLATLLCPSNPTTSDGPESAFVVNCGIADVTPGSDTRANGIFHDRSATPLKVSLDYIATKDGTATTLMVSENLGATTWDSTVEYETGFLWIDQTSGKINGHTKAIALSAADAVPTSKHSGGVVAAFADRHVAFLSDKIDPQVYALICTPDGGSSTPVQSGWLLSPVSEADLTP